VRALSFEIRGQEVTGQLACRWPSQVRRSIEARLELDDGVDARIARDCRLVIAAARREDEEKYNAAHS
jgi:hypothetical protein